VVGNRNIFGNSEIRLDADGIKTPSRSSNSHRFAAVFGKRGREEAEEVEAAAANVAAIVVAQAISNFN
jgi:hypothetical protein